MSMLDVLRTAVTNSFRSKLRTTLTVIAIFIGAFTLTITSAIGTGVSAYINTQLAAIGASDVLTVTKSPDDAVSADDGPAAYDPDALATGTGGFPGAGAGGLPGAGGMLTSDDLDTIAGVEGILDVSPTAQVAAAWIEHDGNGKYQLSVNATAALTTADLLTGSQLSNSSSENEILLPTSYLSSLGFADAEDAVGTTVTIGATDYLAEMHEVRATVVGVQNETLFGSGVGLNSSLTDELADIAATGRPAAIGDSYFAATAHFDPDATDEQITALKDDLARQGYTAQTVADQIGSFQTVVDGIVGVLNAFAIIALIAAGFGIINTLLMSVQERTREIGLMKAMGLGAGKIFALFSAEAVFIGFLGSAIGSLVAIALGSVISEVLANGLLSDLQGLRLLSFDPIAVVVVILLVMLIAFLAGTLPANRAARLDPIDALRYE
ncbi:MAG: ABC transporter permease [Cryobacterium sp.]|nr:ABC transporter permease [Cryobacterium sp.]